MDALKNPTIYISGLQIDEPVTTLTDLIVAAVGIIAFFKTASPANSRGMNLYRWFYLVTGISTGISSLLGHAFAYAIDPQYKLLGWTLGLISITFAQFAALYHTRPGVQASMFKTLSVIALVQLIAAFVLLLSMRTFLAVEIHSAFGLLVMVTTLEGIYFSKTRSALSRYFMIGVGLSIAAVLCHLCRLAISPWFNHLDLSHVFMAAALWTMYKGLKKEQNLLQEA